MEGQGIYWVCFFCFVLFCFCEQLALLATHSEGSKPSSTTVLQDCSPGTMGRPNLPSWFPFPGENPKEDRSTSMQIYDLQSHQGPCTAWLGSDSLLFPLTDVPNILSLPSATSQPVFSTSANFKAEGMMPLHSFPCSLLPSHTHINLFVSTFPPASWSDLLLRFQTSVCPSAFGCPYPHAHGSFILTTSQTELTNIQLPPLPQTCFSSCGFFLLRWRHPNHVVVFAENMSVIIVLFLRLNPGQNISWISSLHLSPQFRSSLLLSAWSHCQTGIYPLVCFPPATLHGSQRDSSTAQICPQHSSQSTLHREGDSSCPGSIVAHFLPHDWPGSTLTLMSATGPPWEKARKKHGLPLLR